MPGPKTQNYKTNNGGTMININWQPQDEEESSISIMAWLTFCLDKLQQGRENEIPLDPFYKSKRRKLTDDYINRIIQAIDYEFEYEAIRFSSYHLQYSGSAKPPDFSKLSKRGRRATVQGIDKLLSA